MLTKMHYSYCFKNLFFYVNCANKAGMYLMVKTQKTRNNKEMSEKCIILPLFLTKNGWSNLHSAVKRPSSGEPGSKVSLRMAWPKDIVSSWLTNFSPSAPNLCEWNKRLIRGIFMHQQHKLKSQPNKNWCKNNLVSVILHDTANHWGCMCLRTFHRLNHCSSDAMHHLVAI